MVAQAEPSSIVEPNVDYDRIYSILNSNVLSGDKLPTSHSTAPPPSPAPAAAPHTGKRFDPTKFFDMFYGTTPATSQPTTEPGSIPQNIPVVHMPMQGDAGAPAQPAQQPGAQPNPILQKLFGQG